ncbi:histone deacetylase superfamily [Thioalkalivibrio sulfidiphilus HL-EbGr7]|uniref:Acetoin utilization protein AcuC n=1 Tax=Thioalkalivibrio sulfidiphilus (strain HL-EbGR7) TaxID=396588 RepID=B8GUC2_THISH|nr:acetoin utilization protein AcuC [Thioalkalivibrio sulfidiphilus]ACL73242.1 histone deacetylase superfamily [Thioalkalivibrio sulfidiphilus HL-EbGr7]
MITPSRTEPTRKALLIGASRYRRHSYGDNHPLGIPRVSLTLDLIRAYGALTEEEFQVSRKATPAELEWFHTREYVSAMQRCEALGKVYDRYRQRHNIGNFENPYFPGFFATPATATYGSIQGAERVLEGFMAFNPAGGMHHAAPDAAQGFCFFNDPVLGILRLRREGLRVLYLDIDAHHGDGVEAAFRSDDQVMTCSLHMDTSYAYPFKGGGIEDTGPLNNAVNMPLPKGMNDDEYRHVFGRLWPAVLEAFRPEVIVLQAGTDILGPDPLGKFHISTQLFLEVVERVINDAPRHSDGTPRLLVVGGGGYHPLMLARCWAGVWGLLSGRELPEAIPPEGEALLRAVDWDQDEEEDYFEDLFTSRLDRLVEGEVRREVRERVDALLSAHPALVRGGIMLEKTVTAG